MENAKQLRNTLLLVFAALLWGTAFVAQSVGSSYMGPYTFLASHSWLACAFLLGLMAVRRVGQHRKGVRLPFWLHCRTLALGGTLCGVVLFAASAASFSVSGRGSNCGSVWRSAWWGFTCSAWPGGTRWV